MNERMNELMNELLILLQSRVKLLESRFTNKLTGFSLSSGMV